MNRSRWVTLPCFWALTIILGLTAPPATAQPRGDRSKGPNRQKRPKDDGALKTGQRAPMLTLKTLDGKKKIDFRASSGKRPIILFFGSYT